MTLMQNWLCGDGRRSIISVNHMTKMSNLIPKLMQSGHPARSPTHRN